MLTPDDDVSLGLLKSMGRDEQVVFARTLERTQLGMNIVNVTPVQNNLLHSHFSSCMQGIAQRWPSWVLIVAQSLRFRDTG